MGYPGSKVELELNDRNPPHFSQVGRSLKPIPLR
jgi:hypothetical protein